MLKFLSDVETEGTVAQVEELKSQIELVAEEATNLASGYVAASGQEDEGYVTLLHSVPEDLRHMTKFTSRFSH